jgi:hypothetical protein
MPYGGHGNESFSVRGVPFKYSDFVITGGFNNTASHGGPITRDAYVRICYDPSNNLILRLEIRGLDLATAARPSFWPTPSAQRAADRDADHAFDEQTWLGFSIFAIWLVDLAGIFTLYRPYLGTFLRLGGIADRFMLRPNLEAETAIKLSHCLIYWDRPGRTIWLRPRGLVLFQIPSVVAKIDIDADDRTVLGWTIRLSSGSAVIVALMIVALYWTLLAMASAGKGPPIPIVAGFGVIIIVILAINLRLLRSRMMGLMESALPELGA